jgi:hypothetical protein
MVKSLNFCILSINFLQLPQLEESCENLFEKQQPNEQLLQITEQLLMNSSNDFQIRNEIEKPKRFILNNKSLEKLEQQQQSTNLKTQQLLKEGFF